MTQNINKKRRRRTISNNYIQTRTIVLETLMPNDILFYCFHKDMSDEKDKK